MTLLTRLIIRYRVWRALRRFSRIATANRVCRHCPSCKANLGPCTCTRGGTHCAQCGHAGCPRAPSGPHRL